MPISLSCPGCRNKLNAPDSAAGKRVKCPKCQKVLTLPAPADDFEVVEDDFEVVEDDFEVVDDDTPPPKKKSKPALFDDDDDDRPRKKRPVSRYEDDDDDEEEDEEEDEDDRPRKKAKKKSGGSGAPVAMLIGGGVLLLIALGVGGYFLFSGGKDKGVKPDSVKWHSFTTPDGSITASFPGGEPNRDDTLSALGVSGAAMPLGQLKKGGGNVQGWSRTENGYRFGILAMPVPAQAIAQMKNMNLADLIGQSKNVEEMKKDGMNTKTMTISGFNGVMFYGKDPNPKPNSNEPKSMAMILVLTNTQMVFIITASNQDNPEDAMVTEFISKINLK